MKSTLTARARLSGDAHPRLHQAASTEAQQSQSAPISARHTERKLETNTIIAMEKKLDKVDTSSSSSGRTKGAWLLFLVHAHVSHASLTSWRSCVYFCRSVSERGLHSRCHYLLLWPVDLNDFIIVMANASCRWKSISWYLILGRLSPV